MKKALIILLLFSSKLIGQNLNDIKLADTIYLYFDINKKFENLHFKTLDNKIAETYVYQFPDGKALRFRNHKNEKQNIYKNKRFFENNKLKIISVEFMQENGFYKMLNSIYKPKRAIYIITKKNIKKNKVVLKKVFMENSPEVIM